jgi:hypothetical protein
MSYVNEKGPLLRSVLDFIEPAVHLYRLPD